MTDVLSPAEDRARALTTAEPIAGASRPKLVPVPLEASKPEQSKPEPSKPDSRDRTREIEEIELMRAVAAHDHAAEAELVRRIIALVRSRARMLTRNKADADDAAQSSLVEILRSAPNFRGEGSLAGWCERITVRTTLRLQRRQDRVVAAIDAAVNPDDVSATVAERKLSETIPGGEVQRYLHELSDDRHQALVLRHVLGHSVDEIAEQTGVSPNTVKDRLRMARKQVRQSIRQREVIAAVKGRLR